MSIESFYSYVGYSAEFSTYYEKKMVFTVLSVAMTLLRPVSADD